MFENTPYLIKIDLDSSVWAKLIFNIRAVVRENRGFFLKFGKCDLTDLDEILHIQSTLRINNFPAIIDFFAKRLPW